MAIERRLATGKEQSSNGTVAELTLKHFMITRLLIPGVNSRQFSLGYAVDNDQATYNGENGSEPQQTALNLCLNP